MSLGGRTTAGAQRAVVVVGLGFGDEGKGTCVDWLADRFAAHTVVRTGGPQALHRVVRASGSEHVFSQFGSATLCGASTHLSRHMVIDPDALLNEGRALQYEHGIKNVFDYITIHRDALVITPYQAIANRVRELARGPERHGSVGIGVGEAVFDALAGRPVVRASELGSRALPAKLAAISALKHAELEAVVGSSEHLAGAVGARAREELRKVQAPATLAWTIERFGLLAARVRTVDADFLAERILRQPGTVVFEGSQGVLLDPEVGFVPYATPVRTVPVVATSLLDECGYAGEVELLGVVRAYHTRHGPGPFVTECHELTRRLPDKSNGAHPWQGAFRVGHADLVALRYAVNACGGPEGMRGIVVTCVDRVRELGAWRYCDAYCSAAGDRLTNLVELVSPDARDTARTRRLTAEVGQLRPELRCQAFDGNGDDAKTGAVVAGVITDQVGVPVVAISIGETARDKLPLFG